MFINWKLMSHPINWGIIWTVLLGAGLAYRYIHDGFKSAVNDPQTVIPD